MNIIQIIFVPRELAEIRCLSDGSYRQKIAAKAGKPLLPIGYNRGMRFAIRSLFIFTAIEAALFLACLKWPVKDFRPNPEIYALEPAMNMVDVSVIPFERPPYLMEFVRRACVCTAIVILAWIIIAQTLWAIWPRKKV